MHRKETELRTEPEWHFPLGGGGGNAGRMQQYNI